MKYTFNSVVFNTGRLAEIRAFYEGQLGFPTGTYEKNGETLPDYSDSYVNYHIGGGLLGFEHEHAKDEAATQPSGGDIVLNVSDLGELREKIQRANIPILKENPYFLMIADPEGRILIFEPTQR